VVVAGHRGDAATARAGLADDDRAVRASALGALARIGELTDDDVRRALTDPASRRFAGGRASWRRDPTSGLLRALLDDDDPTVVEVAAWACGEQIEHVDALDDDLLDRLIELTTSADDPLVREACAAALGAIGDERGLRRSSPRAVTSRTSDDGPCSRSRRSTDPRSRRRSIVHSPTGTGRFARRPRT
jgi:hypothetical protein